MNKVLSFFKDNFDESILIRNIRVYGWKFEYDHLLVSSLTKYLFEDLDIIENIAPETNTNRDGRKKKNYYICVHDTGDTDYDHTAGFWSNVVKVQDWELGRYEASFQYVTGDDGIYHNIPDDEIGYHAGDSTYFSYDLIDTGLSGENEKPVVSISDDGYYMVDGVKSQLLAPRAKLTRKGEVKYDRIARTDEINSQGVLVKNVNGKYYIGVTYYNNDYALIANRGGNNNSVGIESCINVGSDIYLIWQRTAKLVAKLLDENNLCFDDVKQHHYFSGKNCPQTMRMNNLWDHFMELVKFEYQILKFKQEGYKISLKVNDPDVKENGRIVKREFDYINKKKVAFSIITEFEGKIESLELEKEI